jgi:hypothetical protein
VPRPAPPLLGGLLEAVAVRDELTSQNLGAAPRHVMVTTAGVLEVEKMRPVDVLGQVRWLQCPWTDRGYRCKLDAAARVPCSSGAPC